MENSEILAICSLVLFVIFLFLLSLSSGLAKELGATRSTVLLAVLWSIGGTSAAIYLVLRYLGYWGY